MGTRIRTIGVFLTAPLRPRLALFGHSRLCFRVLPGDLDLNVHMNNARYLALMDIGRIDLVLRTSIWRTIWVNRWQAVLAGSLVRYRRPLKPFQKLELTSRLIGWDPKWFYIEHRIESGGILACQAMVRGAFLDTGRIVPPIRLAAGLGNAGESPDLPGWIADWNNADSGMDQSPSPAMAEA